METTNSNLPKFDTLWNFQEPAETQAKFLEILPNAVASGNIGYQVELITQIARTEGLQRKFNEAHSRLDEAEKLLADAGDRAKVRYLLERGRTTNSSGHREESRAIFEEAFHLALSANEEQLAVDAAHMMGIVMDDDESVEWNEKAMEVAENATDPSAKKWLGALYNNLGWTYMDKEEFETALGLFEKALNWREENKSSERQIRIAKWCIARVWRSLGKTQDALQLHLDLLAKMDTTGDEPGYTYEEIAENLWLLDRQEESRAYFMKAHEILSKDEWLQAEESERLARLERLANGSNE